MAWQRIKSALFCDLGGPSITPTTIWEACPLFLIALLACIAAFVIEQLSFQYPIAISSPPPASSPSPIHFAIDDLDLGPRIHLVRFIPDFRVHRALEAANGKLYVEYDGYPPHAWGFEGAGSSRVGVLTHGALKPVDLQAKLPADSDETLFGMFGGLPVIGLRVDQRRRYILLAPTGPRSLTRREKSDVREEQPCVAFDGGQICGEFVGRFRAVRFALPERPPLLLIGATYLDDPPYAGRSERGDIWLNGGGPHTFLLTEYHIGQDAAECLEGYAP